MKTTSSALSTFLRSGAPFIGVDLYAITLVDGTALYYATGDRPVFYGGNTYQCVGLDGTKRAAFQRSRVSMKLGLEAGQLDIDIYAYPGTLVESTALLPQIAQGKWSKASITVRRAFLLPSDVPTNPLKPIPANLGGAGDGTIIWFAGEIGEVLSVTPVAARIRARDLLWYLNRPTPKDTFNPGCFHQLFDSGCTLSKATYTVTGACSAGSTTTSVKTGLTNDSGIATAPTGAPSLGTPFNPGTVTLPAATYYVQITYVTALGETLPSPEASVACSPNNLFTVNSPSSVSGASGWNVYIGTQSGNEQQQNSAPIAFGTNYTIPANGIYLGGRVPPQIATNGYWALGVITFTSGANFGISAFVEGSAADGTVSLRAPLPAAPASGDTFSIIPGCDKQMSTCKGKYSNLTHFGGFPFTPTPENGF